MVFDRNIDGAKTPKEDDCVEPAGGPMICGAFFWVRKSKLPFKDDFFQDAMLEMNPGGIFKFHTISICCMISLRLNQLFDP